MPRVLTQRANKDYPKEGIKKGDTYYKWSIRMGRGGHTFISKTPPRPSQLTQSKMSGAYAAVEAVEDVIAELRESTNHIPYALVYKAQVAVAEREVKDEEDLKEDADKDDQAVDSIEVKDARRCWQRGSERKLMKSRASQTNTRRQLITLEMASSTRKSGQRRQTP